MLILCMTSGNQGKFTIKKAVPFLIGHVNTSLGKEKERPIRILLDGGTTSTIILGEFTKKLQNKSLKPVVWNAKAGNFATSTKCKIQFRLPEFDDNKVIEHTVHADTSPLKRHPKHDTILGTDLLEELGMKLDFKE